jgi:hypothetical protein
MDDEPSELDELQRTTRSLSKTGFLRFVRKKLCSVNHSVTEIDQWEKIRCAGNQRRIPDK